MCASSILYSMAGGQTLNSAVPGTSLPVVQGSQKGAALLLDPTLAPLYSCINISRRPGCGGPCCWTPHLRPYTLVLTSALVGDFVAGRHICVLIHCGISISRCSDMQNKVSQSD